MLAACGGDAQPPQEAARPALSSREREDASDAIEKFMQAGRTREAELLARKLRDSVSDGDAARALTGFVSAMLRPERITLGAAEGARASGVVSEVQYFGAFTRVRVDAAGTLLQADLPTAAGAPEPQTGQAVHLHWDERAVHSLVDRGRGR